MSGPMLTGRAHLAALAFALRSLDDQLDRIDGWGRHLADVLPAGARLLAAGNGGSAALAQHLTSELVGRYCHDRPGFSALALHAEGSSLTAIVTDYGADEGFARQVRAHGRAGDVLLAISTSGASANVLAAADAAAELGMTTWAVTGRAPNPLAAACDEAVVADAAATATVQEVQQVIVHLVCAAFDTALGVGRPAVAGEVSL